MFGIDFTFFARNGGLRLQGYTVRQRASVHLSVLVTLLRTRTCLGCHTLEGLGGCFTVVLVTSVADDTTRHHYRLSGWEAAESKEFVVNFREDGSTLKEAVEFCTSTTPTISVSVWCTDHVELDRAHTIKVYRNENVF